MRIDLAIFSGFRRVHLPFSTFKALRNNLKKATYPFYPYDKPHPYRRTEKERPFGPSPLIPKTAD